MANNNTFYNLVVDNERIGAKNCGSGLASQRHRPARCHRGGRHRGAGAKYETADFIPEVLYRLCGLSSF